MSSCINCEFCVQEQNNFICANNKGVYGGQQLTEEMYEEKNNCGFYRYDIELDF